MLSYLIKQSYFPAFYFKCNQMCVLFHIIFKDIVYSNEDHEKKNYVYHIYAEKSKQQISILYKKYFYKKTFICN